MLDLKHIRAFVVIAACGTIATAARRLAIAESPLGRQLKALERELGQSLFERRGRRLRLTPVGASLLARAQSLLGMAEDLRRSAAADDAGGTGGLVRLGLVPGIAWHPALGRLVAWARRRRPAITLELAVDSTRFLSDGLRSGAHDLILLRRPTTHAGLQSRLLCREELRLVAARTLGPLTGARLLETPWLEPAGRSAPALLNALDGAGLGLRQRVAVPDLATAAAMARSGIGILLTHASMAEALTGVQAVPPPFPYPAQEIHLGWRQAANAAAVEAMRPAVERIFAAPAR